MRYPGIEHGYDVLTILHQYFITDHLGNTRATIDTDGTLSGQADYLPYGRIFWENGVNYWKNRYLWTGKELLTTIFDGTVYDSGARFLFTDGSFASIDPYAEKYPWISPYAYCAGDPINLTDPDGNIIETLLDVASLVDGVRSFVSNVKQGNTGAAIVDGIGIVFDAAAVITPFMPGGASMGIKAVRALDKGADAVKAADRAGDVAKGMKNAERVAEGRQFEKDAAKAAKDAGLDVQTQVRLVPQNGKGNIKGNRSTVDQLIKNEDGTYTVVETKLTPKSKLSTGQKAVRDEVRKGSGSFKIKSSNKDLDDTSITVSRYVIHYNNPSYVNFK